MSSKKLWKEEDAELFKDVVFLVEATYNEMYSLWLDYYYQPRSKNIPVVKEWEQETIGRIVTIGKLDKRPINVQVWWAKLNGKRVLFYEACSQLVDYKLVEEWLKHFTLDKIRWDNDARWAHCDATNFHLC